MFSSFLLTWVLPLIEYSDAWLISSPWAPLVTITLTALAVIFYPGSDRWTPARGDTTIIMGSYLGVHLGVWCNFHLGLLTGPPLPPPYPILWPTYEECVQSFLRMAVGTVILIATRAIAKQVTYYTACLVMGEDPEELKKLPNDIKHVNKSRAYISTKLFPYISMAFNALFVVPVVFQVIVLMFVSRVYACFELVCLFIVCR